MTTSVITRAAFDAEIGTFTRKAETGRIATGLANVRAAFVADLAITGGIEESDGTVATISENEAWKAFGITRSVGQRNVRPARVMLALGYVLDTFPTDVRKAESASVADLSVRANRQGLGKVTDDQWTAVMGACHAGEITAIEEAVAALDAEVESVSEERKAESKAEREERKAEREHATSPAGKVAALVALAADLRTIANLPGGLSEDEHAMIVSVGLMLASVEYVAPVEEIEPVEDAA
jgi:hypothetical protein